MTDSKTTALVPAGSSEVVVANLTEEQINVVKDTICKGYTDTEMRLYLHQCEKMSLDPLARETYTFKAGGIVIGTGIDGFRKRANDTGCYMPGRPTEYTMDGNKLVMARVFVKKLIDGEWHEFSEDAYMEKFKGKGQWNTMPRVMLSKCAEVRVLRRAFPRELGGLYEPAERAAIERNTRPAQPTDPFAPPPVEVDVEVVDTPDEPTQPSPKRQVWERAKELGLNGDDVTAVLKDTRVPERPSKWSVKNMEQIFHALAARAAEATPYDDLRDLCEREGHTEDELFTAMDETGHAGRPVDNLTTADCDEILTAIERAKGV